ncbi:MAG: hypothetical protein ACI35S_08525 [Anaeroplasma sp.]
MARIVRKVSGKDVRGQKRNKGILYSKKFWIIASVIAVIIIAASIITGVVIANNNKSEEEVSVEDYFGMTQKTANGVEVNFEKMSYSGLRMHSNPNFDDTFIEYIFIFATDLNSFYPMDLYDNDGNNLKNSVHSKIFELLVSLQYEIDQVNKADNDYSVKLYIIDTASTSGSENTGLLLDSNYGGNENENVTSIFSLTTEDGLIDSYRGDKGGVIKDINLLCTSLNVSDYTNVINASISFMKSGFKEAE